MESLAQHGGAEGDNMAVVYVIQVIRKARRGSFEATESKPGTLKCGPAKKELTSVIVLIPNIKSAK